VPIPHQQTWDHYKNTIETMLAQGYAPPNHRQGSKGSAISMSADVLQIGAATLTAWVHAQERRQERGKEHRLPDWSLWSHEKALKGQLGYEPVLPGFEIHHTSTSLDQAGNVKAQHITQRPAAGEIFEAPPGFTVDRISANVRGDGRLTSQWLKFKAGANSPEAFEAIRGAFQDYEGRAELCPAPAATNGALLTTYVMGDHHLGLYCWGDETGHDYDLDIGERLLKDTMGELVNSAPASKTALVLSLGDFFHTDSSLNMTSRSSNVLDVDTRRAKVYKIGVKLMISCIEMALQKHENVICRFLPGNHDKETTPTLAIAIWAFFHNEPRVHVDCSPSPFFHMQHGTTMLSGTHGDQAKIFDMPGIMAASQPTMWGATRFRYAFGGHIHHKEKQAKEFNGVICETFQVLPPPDSWHVGMGFGSGRSMTAINYHRERGEDSRIIRSIPPLV
jgi:Calcineurin-like phosphoesterase